MKEKETNAVVVGEQLIYDSIDPILEDLLYLTKIATQLYYQNTETKDPYRFQLLEKTFLSFAESHPMYDQIRLLDAHGLERIRVNFSANHAELVPRERLQDKHQRYYFKDTWQLDPNQVFISPLDLNIEHGQLERPLKPMIRFGRVLTDPFGKKIGVTIINYKAKVLLENLKKWSESQDGNLMLLNRNGYWLASNQHQEWGFMFPEHTSQTFANQEPELWASIINVRETGQIMRTNGLYTYKTVRPLHTNIISSTGSPTATGDSQHALSTSEYYWKIISQVHQEDIAKSLQNFRQQMLAAACLATIIIFIFSFLLARARMRRDQATLSLKKTNENLEAIVAKRTSQLQMQNAHLVDEVNTRKETEQALRESEYKHATLLETMQEGLVVLNPEGKITYCNARLGEMLGYNVEELVGHSMEDFLKEEDRQIFRQQFQYRNQGLLPSYEVTWLTQSGTMLLSSISPALLLDKQKKIIGSFGLVTDITAQRKAELKKQALEHQLQQTQKMEALGTLAGGIAHDFNNILSAIIGYAELAAEKVEPGTSVAKSLEVILSAGSRAAKLVQQILAFSRQSDQDKQPLEIVAVVKETMKLIQAATSSSISIHLDLKENVGQIMANPTQIHQIVMNICTNACHAMAANGGKLSLIVKRVELNKEEARAFQIQPGTFVRLTFSDTGEGIPDAVQQRIFEPFYTTKEVGKGTGLGLSLVHSIVTDLAGSIHVDSKIGQGTTFTIHLPISQQQETQQAIISEKILYGNNEHIIWLDDEAPLMTMGCRILTSLGYQATGFTDPEQCLAEIVRHPDWFQLIISDYNMPKLNGLALLREIRARGINLPMILCSGFSEEISLENARQKGLQHYLMKPVRKYDIALNVHKALHNT